MNLRYFTISTIVLTILCCILLLLIELGFSSKGYSQDQPATQVLVLYSSEYRTLLDDWLQLRTSQGNQIYLTTIESIMQDNQLTPAVIHKFVRQQTDIHPQLRYLILIGNCQQIPSCSLPSYLISLVNQTRSTYASDNFYGDLNQDGVPEVIVGRMPVDSEQSLTRLLDKIVQYEQSEWNSQYIQYISIFTGCDSIPDGSFENRLRQNVAAGMLNDITSRINPQLFQPDIYTAIPHETLSDYYFEPELGVSLWKGAVDSNPYLMFYIGHGSFDCFYMAHSLVNPACINVEQLDGLEYRTVSGPAFLFACQQGMHCTQGRSIATTLLNATGGIPTVTAFTGILEELVSIQYLEIAAELLARPTFPATTLGEMVSYIQQQTLSQPQREYSKLVQQSESNLREDFDYQQCVRQNNWMMTILGDPLLRLREVSGDTCSRED